MTGFWSSAAIANAIKMAMRKVARKNFMFAGSLSVDGRRFGKVLLEALARADRGDICRARVRLVSLLAVLKYEAK